MKKILLLIIFWACIGVLQAQEHFSAASFYPVPNSGREVLDFNPGWRFHRGDIPWAGLVFQAFHCRYSVSR